MTIKNVGPGPLLSLSLISSLFSLLSSLPYYIYIYATPLPPFPSQTQPGRFNFIGSTSPEAFLSWLPLQVCFNFRGSTNNKPVGQEPFTNTKKTHYTNTKPWCCKGCCFEIAVIAKLTELNLRLLQPCTTCYMFRIHSRMSTA